MTLTAQQQFMFGAMCMDDGFRNQLFDAGAALRRAPRSDRVTDSELCCRKRRDDRRFGGG